MNSSLWFRMGCLVAVLLAFIVIAQGAEVTTKAAEEATTKASEGQKDKATTTKAGAKEDVTGNTTEKGSDNTGGSSQPVAQAVVIVAVTTLLALF